MQLLDKYQAGGLLISDTHIECPLDHQGASQWSSEKINVFARLVVRAGGSSDAHSRLSPLILFLQGGPGFECPLPSDDGPTKCLLDRGYRVLYLDQRGTGMSSPVTPNTLRAKGITSAPEQADYLTLFRADSIVRDCELIRNEVCLDVHGNTKPWSVLGQSFGGFCALTYLSFFPQGLDEVFITGGLGPICHNDPLPVYRRLIGLYGPLYASIAYGVRQERRTREYFAKYVNDMERLKLIADHIAGLHDRGSPIRLPSGVLFTEKIIAQLGLEFGTHGGFDRVHQIILKMSHDIQCANCITFKALRALEDSLPFERNPLYAVLHESIYCQGKPSNWSARAVFVEKYGSEFPDTNHFVAEMVFPWMFLDEFSELKGFEAAANEIAKIVDWPALYDLDQLRRNRVPVFAVSYINDLYCDIDLSIETATNIGNCKQWITNRYMHNALRSHPTEILSGLFEMKDKGDDDS